MNKAELMREIRRLPLSDRVELLEELWREAEIENPKLLDWQKDLLHQRLRDAEAHPDDWASWEEARKRLIAIGQRCSSLPDLDTREPDEILGYDETGAFAPGHERAPRRRSGAP